MKRPGSCFVVSALCSIAIVLQCGPVLSQDEFSGSSIRLVSATEPASQKASTEPARAPLPLVIDSRDPPPIPISKHGNPAPVGQPSRIVVPASVEKPSASSAAPTPVRPRMPAGLYAAESAKATLNQLPGPAPVQSAPHPHPARRGGKPFQSVPTQPTVSPYLYLYGNSGNASALSNYFAFVRPQMDQSEVSRQQQTEIQQLRNQLQKVSTTGGTSRQTANMDSAARYMDTAQFYRRPQR